MAEHVALPYKTSPWKIASSICLMIVLGLVFFWVFVRGEAQEEIDKCEKAYADWVAGPETFPAPSILNEGWCVDHLTRQPDED